MKVVLGLALLLALVLTWGYWAGWVEPAIRQPIEFPHKTHLDLKDQKVECTTCHDRAEKSAMAGRPSAKKCLSCHAGGQAKSAEEKKLQAFGENGREIDWQRVWRLPPHVFFSHRIHVAVAKVKCQHCHGPMETLTRPPVRPLKTLTMDDCIGCHERWQWPAEAPAPGAEPVRVAAGRKVSTDCNACHR